MEKPSFLIMDFEGSYEVLLRHKFFDASSFDNETIALWGQVWAFGKCFMKRLSF